MTAHVRRSKTADADIEAIALWIARDNLNAALRWLDELDERLKAIAATPGGGTDRSSLRKGMRSSPFGNYLVFYKPARGGILVVRVLHGARDHSRLFRRR